MCLFGTCLIDTGIASEKEWGINLLDEAVKESGTNEDGSTWYKESGEDLGENGFRCRWARMGSGADGQEWEDRAMMVPLNGKRLYVFGSLLILTDHIPVLRELPLKHACSFK